MPTNWPTYAWYTTAAILGTLGFYLLIKWFIGDRSKGGRRCPKCWYDMSATPGMQCPECGKLARAEPVLHRSRRRCRTVVVGLGLLFTAIVTTQVPAAKRLGWLSRVPSIVLLALPGDPFDLSDPGYPYGKARSVQEIRGRLAHALVTRYYQGLLPSWEHRLLAKERLPPIPITAADIIAHPFVVNGETFCFCVNARLKAGLSRRFDDLERRYVLTPHVPNAPDICVTPHLETWSAGSCLGPFQLGMPSPPPSTLNFDVRLEELNPKSGVPVVLWRGALSLAMREVGSKELACESSSEIDEAFRANTPMSIGAHPDEPPAKKFVCITPVQTTHLISFHQRMRVEIVYQDRVMAQAIVNRELTECVPLVWTSDGLRDSALNADGTWRDPSDPRWTVHVSGVQYRIMCSCSSLRCWSGSYDLPLSECIIPNPTP